MNSSDVLSSPWLFKQGIAWEDRQRNALKLLLVQRGLHDILEGAMPYLTEAKLISMRGHPALSR